MWEPDEIRRVKLSLRKAVISQDEPVALIFGINGNQRDQFKDHFVNFITALEKHGATIEPVHDAIDIDRNIFTDLHLQINGLSFDNFNVELGNHQLALKNNSSFINKATGKNSIL